MDEPIDGHAEEVGTEVATLPQRPVLAVTPPVKAADLVERLATIREAMDTAMQPDVDYGVIPGTNKPALLKPGAEKLSVLFQLDVQLENERIWGPGDHLTVMSRATVYHPPTGFRLGFGEGTCSTRERKYAYRKQERTCPQCGKPAIIKGKAEYGGGWVCFKKKDGCGAKFPDDDQRITTQVVGDVENPDLPDLWNTVVKMAEKRARIDAVLAVTGASALFTQDVEEHETADSPKPAEPSPLDRLRDAFRRAGGDVDALTAHMDSLGVPENEDLRARMQECQPHQIEYLIAVLMQDARAAQKEKAA
jgi:hypothetical protein